MAKYASFTKTPLLIIVSGVVIDNKCCIGIINGTTKIGKRTPIVRRKEYY